MNLSIRTLSREDIDALLTVEAQAQSAMAPTQLREALSDAATTVLGSFQGETLVGYAMVAKQPFDAELHAIGVVPVARGTGLGSALMQAVETVARQWQSERLLLEVRAGNQAAITLYQRMGFNADGRRKGYYPAAKGAAGREDALLMSLALTS